MIIATFFHGLTSFGHSNETNGVALQLAKEMELSEAALLGMEYAAKEQLQKGKASQGMLDCIRAVNKDELAPLFSRALLKVLNAPEINEALSFYATPTAKKYNQYGFYTLQNRFEPTKKLSIPTFTKSEENEIVNFVNSDAGTKLIKLRLLNSPEIQHFVDSGLRVVYEDCKKD